eukprot:12405633-Alexandrium_andersonii.AAC.1
MDARHALGTRPVLQRSDDKRKQSNTSLEPPSRHASWKHGLHNYKARASNRFGNTALCEERLRSFGRH